MLIVRVVPRVRTTEYGVGTLWDQGDLLPKPSIEKKLEKAAGETSKPSEERQFCSIYFPIRSAVVCLHTTVKSAIWQRQF